MQDGRGCRAPTVTHAERTQRNRPYGLAAAIQAEHSHAAEIGVDALAIGHGCFGGVAVLEMPGWRLAAMHLAFPKLFAGLPVDRVDHPAVLVRGRRLAISAEV